HSFCASSTTYEGTLPFTCSGKCSNPSLSMANMNIESPDANLTSTNSPLILTSGLSFSFADICFLLEYLYLFMAFHFDVSRTPSELNFCYSRPKIDLGGDL